MVGVPKHAGDRPITDPVNISELMEPKGVKHVRIRHTVRDQEPPMEPLGVVTEGDGVPMVRGPRRNGVRPKPRKPPTIHRSSAEKDARIDRAFAIHRIARAAAFLILCVIAGIAWTGLLVQGWALVSGIWWCWAFVVGSGLGVLLFSYDLYVAIKYRKQPRSAWKGL